MKTQEKLAQFGTSSSKIASYFQTILILFEKPEISQKTHKMCVKKTAKIIVMTVTSRGGSKINNENGMEQPKDLKSPPYPSSGSQSY